jgi:transposase-like protein
MRDVIRYSAAFKLRLVEEVAAGKYRRLNEARRRNGIRGCATLRKWIKQYWSLPHKVDTIKRLALS